MKEIIRGVYHFDLNEIRNGTYDNNSVFVFYGLNEWRYDPIFVNEIVEVIQKEFPNIDVQAMRVSKINTTIGRNNVGRIMVRIELDVKTVRNNIFDYTIL